MEVNWTPLTTWLVGRRPRRTLVRATVLALATYVLFGHIWRPMLVRGISMEPTLHDGAIRLATLVRYRHRSPERGDIVIIAMAGGRSYYLKRVLALPGETIAFQDGLRLLDGSPAVEAYLREAGHWNMGPVHLDPGQYFVGGDNRSVPFEQHLAGSVNRSDIRGGLLW